jgi:hypothetical protein
MTQLQTTKRGTGLGVQGISPAHAAKLAQTDRCYIVDIRSRERDEPELNFILCACTWRGDPASYPQHRTDVLKQRREAANMAAMEVK